MKIKRKIKKTKNRAPAGDRGVSFIEIMMVITLIAIMSVVVLVSYLSHYSDAKVQDAQQAVASAIESAKNSALSGETQNIVSGINIAPCGYGFRFIDESTYTIYYNFPGGGMSCETENNNAAYRLYITSPQSVREDFKLPNGVKLKMTPLPDDLESYLRTNTEIYFTSPHAQMFRTNYSGGYYHGDLQSSGSNLVLELMLDDSHPSKKVIISSEGVVEKN